MIATILFFAFIGFGAYDTLTYEENLKSGVECETSKPSKCRGFDKETGFKRPASDDSIDDTDFDNLTDSDFVE